MVVDFNSWRSCLSSWLWRWQEDLNVGSHVHTLFTSMAAIGCLVSRNRSILRLLPNESSRWQITQWQHSTLQLVNACWNTYTSITWASVCIKWTHLSSILPSGPGLDLHSFPPMAIIQTGGSPATAAQIDFYNKHGFYITTSGYILRPEVLESNFFAWRVTGDSKYLERDEQAIKSFDKVENNWYASLINVNDNSSNR